MRVVLSRHSTCLPIRQPVPFHLHPFRLCAVDIHLRAGTRRHGSRRPASPKPRRPCQQKCNWPNCYGPMKHAPLYDELAIAEALYSTDPQKKIQDPRAHKVSSTKAMHDHKRSVSRQACGHTTKIRTIVPHAGLTHTTSLSHPRRSNLSPSMPKPVPQRDPIL